MRVGYKQLLGSNRGNALVLSVLIILVLTSVGVVSVQRTSADLMVAGNLTRSTQAFLGSDAGLQHSLKLVGNNCAYLQVVKHQKGQGVTPPPPPINNTVTFPIVDATTAAQAIPPPVPVLSPGDPPKLDLWLTTVNGNVDKARTLQDIAYSVKATWVGEESGIAGFSTDSKICHQLFDFNSKGAIPPRIQTTADTMDPTKTNSMVVTSRARALTGPCQCQLIK